MIHGRKEERRGCIVAGHDGHAMIVSGEESGMGVGDNGMANAGMNQKVVLQPLDCRANITVPHAIGNVITPAFIVGNT